MDSPWECPAPASLAAGESARIDLVALFSETELLAITEATVVTGVVTATYTQDDRGYRVERPASLRINDRHVINTSQRFLPG